MFQPRLSVITIVYNNARDIERTMLSVLNQTYANLEYIIVDGQSTDGTLEIIHKYQSKLTRIMSEPDHGIYDAMNKGLALATGEYILYMNSGDEIYSPVAIYTTARQKCMISNGSALEGDDTVLLKSFPGQVFNSE
jgi:glycosyltransferase involved in cell wall biosynthesis